MTTSEGERSPKIGRMLSFGCSQKKSKDGGKVRKVVVKKDRGRKRTSKDSNLGSGEGFKYRGKEKRRETKGSSVFRRRNVPKTLKNFKRKKLHEKKNKGAYPGRGEKEGEKFKKRRPKERKDDGLVEGMQGGGSQKSKKRSVAVESKIKQQIARWKNNKRRESQRRWTDKKWISEKSKKQKVNKKKSGNKNSGKTEKIQKEPKQVPC